MRFEDPAAQLIPSVGMVGSEVYQVPRFIRFRGLSGSEVILTPEWIIFQQGKPEPKAKAQPSARSAERAPKAHIETHKAT